MLAMSILMWMIAAVLLFAAVMLVTGTGAAGLWIAVIAVGIAGVAVVLARRRRELHPHHR
jgi:LPXTG-motif cell wall-anchored protein